MVKKPLLPNFFTLLQSMQSQVVGSNKTPVTVQIFQFIEAPHEQNRGESFTGDPKHEVNTVESSNRLNHTGVESNISLVENFLINVVVLKSRVSPSSLKDQIVRESHINQSITSQKEKQSLITYRSNSKKQTKLETVSSSQHSIAA